jgi:hypothetical protein
MEVFNPDLIDDLARGKVIIFAGAGVSASAATRNGGRIKGWEAFLKSVTSNVETSVKNQVDDLLTKRDYLLACEILQKHIGDEWDNLVLREFGQVAEPSPLHEAILALNQRIIITTNFDKVLDMCWENKIGTSSHYPRIISKIDNKIFGILKNHSEKYLLKIHGSVDSPETLIFSKSEYAKSAFGNTFYGSFIDTLLLNHTFLFIGFSMDDPALCALMENYATQYEKVRPHYMFSGDDIPENILEMNKRLRKLQIIKYDASDHHKKLPVLISALSKDVRQRKREIFSESADFEITVNTNNSENVSVTGDIQAETPLPPASPG